MDVGELSAEANLRTDDTPPPDRKFPSLRGRALAPPLTGHGGPVWWVEWGRIGDRPVLATGGEDKTVRLWDPANGTPLGDPLTVHTDLVQWGAWGLVDGRPVLATGDGHGSVRLWDPANGTPLGNPLTGHTDSTRWGTWGVADGQPCLATASADGTVRLWEVIEDRPVPRLPTYRSDATTPVDELARAGDAVALAELVTAVTVRPPLAVGLFGDWGEGKSHFLGLLEQQVKATARPDNPLAHSAVRQVRFNAWHYAETDLWASLVAELFAQLAAPPDGDLGSEQRRQSRLAADLVAQRGLRERLEAARGRRDDLQHALHEAARGDLGSWEALSEEQKQQLAILVGKNAESFYLDAVRTVATFRETGRRSWRFVRSLRPATVGRFAVLLFVVLAAAGLIGWLIPALAGWSLTASATATLITAAGLYRHARAEITKRAGAAWKTAVRMAEAQRQRLQTAADVAAAEVAALEREVQNLTAAGQLAGMVADRAAAGDYRSRLGVMTQIREDFTRMAALLADAADSTSPASPAGGEGGDRFKPTETTGAAATTDAAGDTLPSIDRIIIYIDDLDRCPPARVVEMLEAIHLLLAVPLFVVVVAVDPRWLLRAIATHYRELLESAGESVGSAEDAGYVDPDDEELWRSTPAQYLEKIFQVVLTLPPLDTGGYQRMLRTLVGTRRDQPTPTPSAPPTPPGVGPPTEAAPPTIIPATALTTDSDGDNKGSVIDGPGPGAVVDDQDTPGMFGVKLPPARAVERVDPLTLEPDEVTLLDLLGPPLLVATPRAVKRLANSYGLLTAIRRDHRNTDLAEQRTIISDPVTGDPQEVAYRPYRAGMVLLAALVAFPALGPALFLHLHHTATENRNETWERFLSSLQPVQKPGFWQNRADPSMTPVQAQQWQALLDGLHHTGRIAADRQLPLPEPLSAWHQWVVPVGRLSFPTGRIVNSLDRQRPLASPDAMAKAASTVEPDTFLTGSPNPHSQLTGT